MIQIYNGDCRDYLRTLPSDSIDCVVTSPPYNLKHVNGFRPNVEKTYDLYTDRLHDDDYRGLCLDVFKALERVVKRAGVVCWNVSYSKENNEAFLLVMADVIRQTAFTLVEMIAWKKPMAITVDSPNRLTRIVEPVFVLVKRDGFEDYYCNKEVSSVYDGRNRYKAIFNFVETKSNNDGATALNRATFPTELASWLLNVYCPDGGKVLDPFLGTGTTAMAARGRDLDCFGSELSKAQCEYAYERLGGGDDFFTDIEMI